MDCVHLRNEKRNQVLKTRGRLIDTRVVSKEIEADLMTEICAEFLQWQSHVEETASGPTAFVSPAAKSRTCLNTFKSGRNEGLHLAGLHKATDRNETETCHGDNQGARSVRGDKPHHQGLEGGEGPTEGSTFQPQKSSQRRQLHVNKTFVGFTYYFTSSPEVPVRCYYTNA